MLPPLSFRLPAAIALAVVMLANAHASDARPAAAFAAPTDLRVTLVDPLNIVLEWKDHATHDRGYVVEYQMYRDEDFVVLGFVPPHAPRFRHENLAPETRFIYRVRPFFGSVSRTVTLKTGKASSQTASDDEWAEPRRDGGDAVMIRKSVRDPATAVQAAPAELTAALVQETGMKLAWRDRASDEEGYMVEIKVGPDPEFRVCALLDPDTVSFGLAGLPPETEVAVRVRAFFYGAPSNTAEEKTGAAETGGSRG